MKEKLPKQKQPKIKYSTTIEYNNDEFKFSTCAIDEKNALNNFLYQLSQVVGEPVPLLRWKYNEGQFEVNIRKDP